MDEGSRWQPSVSIRARSVMACASGDGRAWHRKTWLSRPILLIRGVLPTHRSLAPAMLDIFCGILIEAYPSPKAG
jgi:hypothetical protein